MINAREKVNVDVDRREEVARFSHRARDEPRLQTRNISKDDAVVEVYLDDNNNSLR